MAAVPFDRSQVLDNEHAYIDQALASGKRPGGDEVTTELAGRMLSLPVRRSLGGDELEQVVIGAAQAAVDTVVSEASKT